MFIRKLIEKLPAYAAACLLITITACNTGHSTNEKVIPENTSDSTPQAKQGEAASIQGRERLNQFFSSANKAFEKANRSSKILSERITFFVETPSVEGLEGAQLALRDSHNRYLATQVFRQTAKAASITHPELDTEQIAPDVIHSNHIRLDQSPIIPGYLDTVKGYPNSGFIHSEQEITEENLNKEHQFTDTAYVAIGYHALAFLLHGESEGTKRVVADFSSVNPAIEPSKQQPSYRRSTYIKLLASLIAQDIQKLSDAWIGTNSFYQKQLSDLSYADVEKHLKQAIEHEKKELEVIGQSLKKTTLANKTPVKQTSRAPNSLHDNQEVLILREEQLKALNPIEPGKP